MKDSILLREISQIAWIQIEYKFQEGPGIKDFHSHKASASVSYTQSM